MSNPGLVKPLYQYLKGFLIGGSQQISDTTDTTGTYVGIDYSKTGISKITNDGTIEKVYPVFPVINESNYLSWFSQSFNDDSPGYETYYAIISDYNYSYNSSVDDTTGKANFKFTSTVYFTTSNGNIKYGILQVCIITGVCLMVTESTTKNVNLMLAEYKPSNAIEQSPSNITFNIYMN